ncbi:trigger factor [Peredibacter sp. HCB2-198]|uniref:trigger factor n=1 Tax=Peredibacter sp. HCB2-198 TaxID=3383025 RepID=UPI0038B597AB
MSYTIENVNGCTKKLVFNFDKVDLTKEIKEALVAKQANSNLKGFRKGKAPLEMVQKLFGPQIENDALYRFISEQYYNAVKKENIRAVGYPQFGNTKYESGKNVSFDATVEIIPDFELKDYSKLSFKKDSETVTDEDFETLKKNYLGSKAEIAEVKDAGHKLAKGDFAVFNFEGEKADGSKPENMKASEYMLEIGSGQFIPGFEDGMIGLKKGEKKDVKVTFPADYHEADLQNAPVTFHVELLEIKQKNFPEFNDEIAKEFGFESVADFTTKNKERMAIQKKREVTSKLQQEILEKLISENSFEVPKALVDDQKESVKEELSRTLKQQGFNDQMIALYFERWDADVTSKATFQVRSGLILDKLAKKYNIEATEADLDAKIDEMVSQSGMKKDEIAKFYKSNENIKRNLMYAIREEKTFASLMKDMKVS